MPLTLETSHVQNGCEECIPVPRVPPSETAVIRDGRNVKPNISVRASQGESLIITLITSHESQPIPFACSAPGSAGGTAWASACPSHLWGQ